MNSYFELFALMTGNHWWENENGEKSNLFALSVFELSLLMTLLSRSVNTIPVQHLFLLRFHEVISHALTSSFDWSQILLLTTHINGRLEAVADWLLLYDWRWVFNGTSHFGFRVVQEEQGEIFLRDQNIVNSHFMLGRLYMRKQHT